VKALAGEREAKPVSVLPPTEASAEQSAAVPSSASRSATEEWPLQKPQKSSEWAPARPGLMEIRPEQSVASELLEAAASPPAYRCLLREKV